MVDGGEHVSVDAGGLEFLEVAVTPDAAGEGDRRDIKGLSSEDIGFGVANHPGVGGRVGIPGEVGDRFFEELGFVVGLVAVGGGFVLAAPDGAEEVV